MSSLVHHFTLEDLANKVGGAVRGDGTSRVRGVESDTRRVRAEHLFVALPGDNFDGHAFAADAAAAGATAVLGERVTDAAVPHIVVEDSLLALQTLGAALFRDIPAECQTIALTGSNGKTTTKELLRCVWSTVANVVHATAGNFNNHIGVPLTLCDLPEWPDVVIVEMGSNGFGDIAHLVSLAPAKQRIITSIGAAHIEGFGSLDGVRRAKAEIFDQPTEPCVAIVPESEKGLVPGGFEQWTVGGDVRVVAQPWQAGFSTVHISTNDFTGAFRSPLPGPHNAHNLATAVTSLLAAGITPNVPLINAVLAELELPGGRWRVVEVGSTTFVDDAYNANPSSVVASYDAFLEIHGGSDEVAKVAVIGQMNELGPNAAAMHAEVAKTLDERGGVDAFIFVGDFADAMNEATTAHESQAFGTVDDARTALRLTGADVVFLKASRGQRLERIMDGYAN